MVAVFVRIGYLQLEDRVGVKRDARTGTEDFPHRLQTRLGSLNLSILVKNTQSRTNGTSLKYCLIPDVERTVNL
jgi:hypothetical protein